MLTFFFLSFRSKPPGLETVHASSQDKTGQDHWARLDKTTGQDWTRSLGKTGQDHWARSLGKTGQDWTRSLGKTGQDHKTRIRWLVLICECENLQDLKFQE